MNYSLKITESRKLTGRRRTNFCRSFSGSVIAETPLINIRRRQLFTTSRQIKEELIVAAPLRYQQKRTKGTELPA